MEMAALLHRSPTSLAKLLHIDGGEEKERESYRLDNKTTYETIFPKCAWRGTIMPESEATVREGERQVNRREGRLTSATGPAAKSQRLACDRKVRQVQTLGRGTAVDG